MDIAHLIEESQDEEPLYTDPDSDSPVPGHLNRVAELTGKFAREMSPYNGEIWERWGYLTGLWHDLGKFSREFQRYIRKEIQGRYDHSTAGALQAMHQFPVAGDLIAYAVAGHHGGIPDGTHLFGDRIRKELPEWKRYASDDLLTTDDKQLKLPLCSAPENNIAFGFTLAFLTRMLFSCLVDADFLATEMFMNRLRFDERPKWPEGILDSMSQALEEYIANKERETRKKGEVSGQMIELRAAIHSRCLQQGTELKRGIYRLNVPTGGGKTLSSLSFALRHACAHGLKRVIYVIPYTSIIDQTAKEFRDIFARLSEEIDSECALAHHSKIDPDRDTDKVRLMSENWDSPLIVTTAVQFFESLFSNKPSRCRKIHQCGNAVIIFDEAQCLPSNLLAPCIQAMKCLNRDYGSSLILCTATQPSLERTSFFPIGWESNDIQSLLGEEMEDSLFNSMKRVSITRIEQKLSCEDLARYYQEKCAGSSALMIVNTTRHAAELFRRMQQVIPVDSVFHLSARMVPKHRETLLNTVKERLSGKYSAPTILVATRVVEAGVDLSFPVVFREHAGLDSLAQAAGRCNRHQEIKDGGQVFSFVSSDFDIPSALDDLRAAAAAARDVWTDGRDIFDRDVIAHYFQLYYNNRETQTSHWDDCHSMKKCRVNIGSEQCMRTIQFKALADEFHLICPGQHEILLAIDDDAKQIIEELSRIEKIPGLYPGRQLLKRIGQYSIQVYDHEYQLLQQRGIVQSYADDTIHVVTDLTNVYDFNTGFIAMNDYSPIRGNYIS